MVLSLGFFGDIVAQHAYLDTVPMPQRRAWIFDGGVFDITDDPIDGALRITFSVSILVQLAQVESFVADQHAAPTPLTDANTILLFSGGTSYILNSATLTADRTFTLGTSDSPPAGTTITIVVETQAVFRALLTNGGIGGGLLVLGTVQPGQNCAGTWVFRFDGTNWKIQRDAGRHLGATTATAGLMSATDKTLLNNLAVTPTVSYSSGSPTLTPAANTPETIFYLSGTVTNPKLAPASTWIGQKAIVKLENLGGGATVVADTGNPDLIDGAVNNVLAGVWDDACYLAKAVGVIRVF